MVTVTDYQLRKSEDGRDFFALILQSGIEMVKSQSGSIYATAKKASIPSTFNEPTCQALIGTELPGSIQKVECEPYTFFLPENGEAITRNHRYFYFPEEFVNNVKPVQDFEVKTKPSKNGLGLAMHA